MQGDRPVAATYGLNNPQLLRAASVLAPELFASLAAVARLRIPYPIRTRDELLAALPDRTTSGPATGAFDREVVDRYFLREFFPMNSPDELVSRTYVALMAVRARAREESQRRLRLQPLPPDAAAAAPEPVRAMPIFCPAGAWIKVLDRDVVGGQYTAHFSDLALQVVWRKYSTSHPFFSEGSHDAGAPFVLSASEEPVLELWFRTSGDVFVNWAGQARSDAGWQLS